MKTVTIIYKNAYLAVLSLDLFLLCFYFEKNVRFSVLIKLILIKTKGALSVSLLIHFMPLISFS